MKDLTADITCPNCHHKVKIKVKDMVPGQSKRLSCGCIIQFTGDDGRKMQRAVDDLERKLKKLNRK
jgi:hypothetical protein